jgi:hypothetical protein
MKWRLAGLVFFAGLVLFVMLVYSMIMFHAVQTYDINQAWSILDRRGKNNWTLQGGMHGEIQFSATEKSGSSGTGPKDAQGVRSAALHASGRPAASVKAGKELKDRDQQNVTQNALRQQSNSGIPKHSKDFFYFGCTHSSQDAKLQTAIRTWAGPLGVIWYRDTAGAGVNHVISHPGGNAYNQITWRLILIWKHVYNHYPDYNWYVRLWDDNYIIKPSFEALAVGHDPNDLIEIGRLGDFNGKTFVGGGAGSLLSKGAMNEWGKRIGECEAWLNSRAQSEISCAFTCEDVLISICRSRVGVRFIIGKGLYSHAPSHKNVMKMTYRDIECNREGAWELVNSIISIPRSFHYVSPSEMETIHNAVTNSSCGKDRF